MDRGRDCAAESTNPSAQLWIVERRKHYDEIPVRLVVCVCDDAPEACTSETSDRQLMAEFSRGLVMATLFLRLFRLLFRKGEAVGLLTAPSAFINVVSAFVVSHRV